MEEVGELAVLRREAATPAPRRERAGVSGSCDDRIRSRPSATRNHSRFATMWQSRRPLDVNRRPAPIITAHSPTVAPRLFSIPA